MIQQLRQVQEQIRWKIQKDGKIKQLIAGEFHPEPNKSMHQILKF